MSIFSSVVFFHFRPCFSKIAGESATQENIEMLVAPRVRMFDAASRFHALEMFAIAAAVAAENDDNAPVVIARSPEPVALMIANRFRQSELRTEEVEPSGV